MLTRLLSSLCLLVAAFIGASPAVAATAASAPYLASSDGSVERLPLLQTQVDATIAGVIANVEVRQVYENRGDTAIEAIYVFPASSRAAVHALTLRIGDRVIRADIREKETARREYDAARAEGKTASLLEQLDPSIFRMSVANVLPGDRVEVTLAYTELLVPTKGEYEFFLPNTVGSRYAAPGDAPVATPSSSKREVTEYALDIRVNLLGALPLQRVDSPSHAVDVARPNNSTALVTLAQASEASAATRDYVLRFRYAADAIESGMLLFADPDSHAGGYFLLLAEPPAAVAAGAVPPREFVFVVDVSGSMTGQPLDIVKDLMRDLLGALRDGDTFNVVLFAGDSRVLEPDAMLPANDATLERARKLIDDTRSGGGTELMPALETAYALPTSAGRARSVVIVTDGAIWAGGAAYRQIRDQLGKSNAFVFGIGPSVEREVIERLARAGAGEPFIVDELGRGDVVARQLRDYVDRPLLTGIRIGASGAATRDMEPDRVPDLLAERPIVVVGRYDGAQAGVVTLQGTTGAGPWRQEVTLDPALASPTLEGVRHLWARARIQRLIDEQSGGNGWYSANATTVDHAAEITSLGLDYSLLTPYTSFVAVDEVVRSDGATVPVQQPAVAKASAGSLGGIGNALPPSSGLAIDIRTEAPAAPPATATQTIGGRIFHHVDGVWTDTGMRSQTVLRIRPDSAAWAQLLVLHPEFAQYRVLGTHVLVAFTTHAILLTPDGFSDYPVHVLRAAVQPGRG